MGTSPRWILSWLRRCRRDELPVERVLDTIRSVDGVVPLGGRVGGVDGGVTPPSTPQPASFPLFSTLKDGNVETVSSDLESDEATKWKFLLTSVQLPSSGGPHELRRALETLQKLDGQEDQSQDGTLDTDHLRQMYFEARRDFFAVRIELLRAARNVQHPNVQAAGEVVNKLLKDGLGDVLLDEVHSRQFCQAPSFQSVGKEERKAIVAWEVQFLEEEALLRELLLLTLEYSGENATLERAVTIAKAVYNWDVQVLNELIMDSTLALPRAQRAARKLTHVGVLVALRMLHTAVDALDHKALLHASETFFLTKVCELSGVERPASPVPGVLLLAWATLLGRQYHKLAELNRESVEVKELKDALQQSLAAAERLHSFHYLNSLLRSLIFGGHSAKADHAGWKPFLQPLSLNTKTLWSLPTVAVSAGLNGVNATHLDPFVCCDSAPVYQYMVAVFLDDMLSSLGYIENLENAQELHAMVKFVLPTLSNARVSQQIFEIESKDSCVVDSVASLRELLMKTQACLPGSLVSCMQMFTALCCNYQGASSSTVLRHVLRYFSTPHARRDDRMVTRDVCRPLPPTEYYTELKGEHNKLLCTRSFAYDSADERLVVPVNTVGMIVRAGDDVKVTWLFSDNSEDTYVPTMWDLLFLSADRLVAGQKSRSFSDLYHVHVEDIDVLTSFFEFLVQLGKQEDGSEDAVEEMTRCWGKARLRHWWIGHQLPSPQVYVSQLVAQQISLSTLLSASSENLVSWGIRDRYVREQILVKLGNVGGFGIMKTPMGLIDESTTHSMASFSVDGGIHLLRLLLALLDEFLHTTWGDDGMEGDSACFSAHLHLVAASFFALRAVLATASGVELFMSSSLGSGPDECHNLIVKSAKKFFEMQERSVGEYPVVLATQDIFMSVVRWFLLKEAQSLAIIATNAKISSVRLRAFIGSERLWFVSAAEFANEILSTYESWKFAATSDRCEITERCFRLLYVLTLLRKYINERNDMLPAFETALRETLSTDTSFLMKLLRSSCAVLSTTEGQLEHWNAVDVTGDDEHCSTLDSDIKISDDHIPLRYKSEFGSDEVNMVQLESLVTTCLRFVTLLITNSSNVVDIKAARTILLMPMGGGGSRERMELTTITLCGEYLGYSLEKAPGIAYWSLRILQHAAVAVDYRQERDIRASSSMRSLVALFHGYQSLGAVRRVFAQLLQMSSTQRLAMHREVIRMLALCLKHQPGFLALLFFGDTVTSDPKSDTVVNEKGGVDDVSCMALLMRFFEVTERLLEQASDFFCELLAFVVQVWDGAIYDRHSIHLKIMATLRACPSFWSNVTHAIKIHMPLDSAEERGVLDMELAAVTSPGRGDTQSLSSSSEVYFGRSSAYGYMARGLILQLVSYEWHNQASKQNDHPLVDVLELFRKEGLYSHWLRTFTRLDYSPVQLRLYASSIQRACNLRTPITSILDKTPVGGVSTYLEGLICNARQLEWQISAGDYVKRKAYSADACMLKLVQWSNLQAAYLHAQLFSLSKWKVFMELCCFQVDKEGHGTSGVEMLCMTEPRCLKRKESMISSPPRDIGTRSIRQKSATSMAFLSTSSSDNALSSSRFSGDRTSFEMIRVLADVIEAKVDQHENQNEVLDLFVLLHLHDLAQLLVSMLHHQLCQVVHKTHDPKFSQTRQRLEGSDADFNFKLDARATSQLLNIVHKAASAVHDSIKRFAVEVDLVKHDADNQSMSDYVVRPTSVPLISRLVTDFEERVKFVTDGLLTLLFTAALLLVRHLAQIGSHPSHMAKMETEATSVLLPKPVLQVKLINHCMNVFALCNDREPQTKSSKTLFQLSWCLFQEVLDSYGNTNAGVVGNSVSRLTNMVLDDPFVAKLEYDQQGIGALFHLLVQRFRPSSQSKEVTASQEEACQVLRGLAAVVWKPANVERSRRVWLSDNSSASALSRLRLVSMFATQLLPLLRSQMEREESTSKFRGYALSASDEPTGEGKLERSTAHQMWCLVLNFVSGLLRLQAEATVVESRKMDVWEFMSCAEPLLLAAVEPSTCRRFTCATIAEHQALLRLLNGLSRSASTRKRWRQAFPTSAVVLMEQSRQLLRRACTLLGSSSTEKNRSPVEKEVWHARSKSVNKGTINGGGSLVSRSPRSPRSPSSFAYSCQTLLHDHLRAVRDVEKRKLSAFHQEMETELVEVVRLASLLLSKWTASPTDRDAIVVVDGVRCVDEEQLVPLLAFIPPSEARSMNSRPGLGHLSLAMDFILDQLLAKRIRDRDRKIWK
uniref:Uncharacterized protein n=1 Tax=Peronospora matthiolae TaxID=2874970 RepID=A0AAV1TBT7_9STRA